MMRIWSVVGCLVLLGGWSGAGQTAEPIPDTPITLQVTTFADVVDADGTCSLREAVMATNEHVAVDTCPAGTEQTTILVPGGHYPLTAQLELWEPVTIRGQGHWPTKAVLDGQHQTRIFFISNAKSRRIILDNLDLAQGTEFLGGAVLHDQGAVVFRKVECYRNHANAGGCLHKALLAGDRHTIRFVDSVLRENTAGDGAAIWFSGNLHLQRTQVFGNRIPPEFAPFGHGPGLYHHHDAKRGVLTLEDVFLVGNTGPQLGECRFGLADRLRLKLLGQNTLGLGCTLEELLRQE